MTERRTTAERNAVIDRVFARALDMGAAERAAWLDELRSTDRGLAEAVERLLAAATRPDPRLDPEQWVGRRLRAQLGLSESREPRAGERIGAYRVLEEIGRGGMSVVYLAERADGLFEQQVALKFLGVTSEAGVRRFERERRILAALDHPGIARLLDGGTDARGRPYIVMERVRGRRLDEYCAATGATLERRLELVAEVADALEYAHRNLVVHRDIKPSNILVTEDGRVKLLDFGIAKLVAADGHGTGGFATTRTLVRLLTPEYASPEQVRDARITTASDIYQLGVVLYELLSGRRPHSFSGATAAEMERAICEEEPAPPSVAVTRRAQPDSGMSAAEAKLLRRRLRGDLDTIVMKALAREPERRYASVGELRDDLQRFRDGVPVRARSHTALYRAAKFVRRHRTGVATIALVIVLLGAWAATVTVHSRRLAAEAARTTQVKELLTDLFTAANPGVSRGAEPTASELLEAGARRVTAELGPQPDLQAEMLTLLGEVYGTMGRYDAAASLLEPALALRRRLLRPADPEIARTAHQLAQVEHIRGNLEAADALLREALWIRRSAFGQRSWQTLMTLDDLGDLLHTRGRLEEAETVLRRALALHGDTREQAGTVLRHLANVRRDRGSYDDAEALYRESIAHTEALHGATDPITALTRSELAVLLAETGRYADAEALLQHNLAVYAVLYPNGHAMEGTTLRNLGLVRLRQGVPAEAEALLHESIATYSRWLPEGTSHIPRAQRYIAEARLSQGDAAGAAAIALDAVRQLDALGLEAHPASADALEIAGLARLAEGDAAAAGALFARSLSLRLRSSIETDPRIEATREHLREARTLAAAQ